MSGNPNSEVVLVTGANGFLAGHVIKILLNQKYSVIGTVRSDKVGRELKRLLHDDLFYYELAELSNAETFNNLFKKHAITKVIHTASPYNFSILNYETEMIKATVDGMKNLLSCIKRYGHKVTHIINTSSLSAHFTLDQYSNPNLVINEYSWCNYTLEQGLQDVFKANTFSKAESEKMFWNFINENRNKFIGTSISPPFIFGPQPFDEYIIKPKLNQSSNLIRQVLNARYIDDIPLLFGYAVDVRDVARLHIESLKTSNMNYKRLAPFSGKFSLHHVLDFTKKSFPKVANQLPPFHDIDITFLTFDNLATMKCINFPLNDVSSIIYDTVEQMLRVENRI